MLLKGSAPDGELSFSGLLSETSGTSTPASSTIVSVPGARGATGPKGDKGDPGDGLQIDGQVDTYADLPGSATAGDAYLAGGLLYIYDGTAWPAEGTGASVTGPQGPIGPAGPQGPQGVIGAQGAQGPQGAQGIQGDTGPALKFGGTVGTYTDLPTGLTSTDANKAYVVSADGLLYVWDGSEFPAEGTGAPFTGPAGPQGPQGDTGATGAQGLAGAEGIQGQPGVSLDVTGTIPTYADLPTDLTAADLNKAYIVAADGKLYIWDGSAFPADGSGAPFVGPQGPTGAQGIQGPKGDKGDKGDTGATGATGPTGPAGAGIGTPATATVPTSEATTSTSYTDLTTTTDAVTVTIGSSGMALVLITSYIAQSTSQNYAYVSFQASGTNAIAASDSNALVLRAGSYDFKRMTAAKMLTGLATGSTTFKMKYKVSAGTGTFQDRDIVVIPF